MAETGSFSRNRVHSCIAAAIRECMVDPNRLQTLAAGSYRGNEFTTDMLGQRLQEPAPGFEDPASNQ